MGFPDGPHAADHSQANGMNATNWVPRTNVPAMEPVILAWSLSKDLHLLNPGAHDERLMEAEAVLGRKIPASLRAVYEITDGAAFFSGLIIDPLLRDDGKLCFSRNSDWLRSVGWEIPRELAIFGGNGGDVVYGIWLPRSERALSDSAVVEVSGPNTEMRFMALAGTSFARFATWLTSYCLLGDLPGHSKALEALGVPERLRREPDFETYVELCRWADPDLPHYPPDVYTTPASLNWLRRNFGAAE